MNFLRMRQNFGGRGKKSKQNMVNFIFREAIFKVSIVMKPADILKRGDDPQLFFHAPFACFYNVFSRTWMRATGVGPKTRGVIFSESTLLQKEFKDWFFSEDEHRKGAV